MEQETKQKILDFLKEHSLTVLSYTNSNHAPQSATVEYVVTDNLEILFNTFSDKRKYQNIVERPDVSFVVGWDWDENMTVQYEGAAQELKGLEVLKYSKIYFEHLPSAKQFADAFKHLGSLIFFRVKPKRIRFSDFNKEPWEISEVNF
jgi:uncharacterized pyridoxamine 5'-phosphate oxidase family protein